MSYFINLRGLLTTRFSVPQIVALLSDNQTGKSASPCGLEIGTTMTGPFAPRVVADCGASFVRPGWTYGPSGGLSRLGHKVKDRQRRVCRQICAEWASNNVPAEVEDARKALRWESPVFGR